MDLSPEHEIEQRVYIVLQHGEIYGTVTAGSWSHAVKLMDVHRPNWRQLHLPMFVYIPMAKEEYERN